MKHAIHNSFTRNNITSAFRGAGLWPVEKFAFLNTPRPRSQDEPLRMLSVTEIEQIYQLKRAAAYRRIPVDGTVVRRAFVDTTRGIVLNNDAALRLAFQASKVWEAKKTRIEQKEAQWIVTGE